MGLRAKSQAVRVPGIDLQVMGVFLSFYAVDYGNRVRNSTEGAIFHMIV
jgi:hypothetical protein